MKIKSKHIRASFISFLSKWNLLNLALGSLDIFSIFLAFECAYLLNYYWKYKFFFLERDIVYLFLGLTPFWLLVLYLIKITEIPRTKRYKVLFFEYLQSAGAVLFVLIIIYFVFKWQSLSRLFLIELALFGFVYLFLVRIFEYKMFKDYRAKGNNLLNVVLIANDDSAVLIEELIRHKEWGYKIIAIITNSEIIRKRYEENILLLSEENLMVINDLMESHIVDEVLFLKTNRPASMIRSIIRSCEELGVIFKLLDTENQPNLTNGIITHIGKTRFLTFTNIPSNPYAIAFKRVIDLGVSLAMILLLLPLLIFIGLSIKLSSRGPIIYKQVRVGLRGRLFPLYKFRTMVKNADNMKTELEEANEADGPVFKIKDDPRVTKAGKILRQTGLDELPQLFNILKGEMSLIGPRPPIPEEIQGYKRYQLRRLSVRPGLSCFWQIKPNRNDIKFEKWIEMDLAYIDNWSIRLDLIIFLKTIKTVFNRTGA